METNRGAATQRPSEKRNERPNAVDTPAQPQPERDQTVARNGGRDERVRRTGYITFQEVKSCRDTNPMQNETTT